MNQGDRAWLYSAGPTGTLRRFAYVTDRFDDPARERVNLCVFAKSPTDAAVLGGATIVLQAVPVRYDYAPAEPVTSAFCAPMDPSPPSIAPAGSD